MWMGERHGISARRFGGRKFVRRDGVVQFPIGEDQVVTQSLWIVEKNRMKQARQLVFNPDPHLYEYPVIDIRDHVRGRVTDDLGLTNVVGER